MLSAKHCVPDPSPMAAELAGDDRQVDEAKSMRFLTMLLVPPGGVMSHSLTTYMNAFADLAASGVPITAFVDPALAGEIDYPHVDVIEMTYDELPTSRLSAGYSLVPPANRTIGKDTVAYMNLTNAKASLPALAEQRGVQSDAYAIIDFGLLKCCRHVEIAQERLRRLATLRPTAIWIPGAQRRGRLQVDFVHWRFLGGLFFGPRDQLLAAGQASERLFAALLPRVTWEVDLWAWMEAVGAWDVRWYPGDHDDTIFDVIDAAASAEGADATP